MCRKSVRMWSNMLYYSSVWSDNGGKNSFPIVAGQSLKWPASSRVPGTAKFSPELCDSMHIKLPSHNHASVLRYQVSKCIYCKSAKKNKISVTRLASLHSLRIDDNSQQYITGHGLVHNAQVRKYGLRHLSDVSEISESSFAPAGSHTSGSLDP